MGQPAKNKQKNTSFADLVADSELVTEEIQIGDHTVVIRELTGRERFSLSERAESDRWGTMLFVAHTGLVDPKPDKPEALDEIKTEWVVRIANAILALSGMDEDTVAAAEKVSADGIDIGGS